MPSNQLQVTDILGRYRRELEKAAVVPFPQPMALDSDVVERAAQALFEFVFSSCERVEWATCDEETKQGFRGEAKAVIVAAWPLLFR
jgi:hypothetical protein